MNIKDIVRCFYEERSNTCHKTIASAKRADKFPYVSRVWIYGEKVLGKETVFAYGESVGTIKGVDRFIEETLRRKGIIGEDGQK